SPPSSSFAVTPAAGVLSLKTKRARISEGGKGTRGCALELAGSAGTPAALALATGSRAWTGGTNGSARGARLATLPSGAASTGSDLPRVTIQTTLTRAATTAAAPAAVAS